MNNNNNVIERLFSNLNKLGKEIGLDETFLNFGLNKAKVIFQEKEAEMKAKENPVDLKDVLAEMFPEREEINLTIYEDKDNYTYLFYLPGIKSKENISIDLNKNILTISAEREKQENVIFTDISFGKLSRSVELPESFKEIIASYEDGILSVIVEKNKEFSKKIDII